MTQVILDGMKWLGLDWDEGPFHQADGLEQHRADAVRLLETGAAYRCFCTAEELEQRRKAASAKSAGAFRYDRRCRAISREESARRAEAGEAFTIRFNVPEGTTGWDDAVHGRIEVNNTEIEDFIILRSDGTPIYNLAVVSDDIAMQITHVIRGDDHINNTPKQRLIYQALGAALPVFAHVPMILGSDGKKLSKRHGATAIGDYQSEGILPDAMRNFLALLGWSPGDDREIMPEEELIARFSLEGINKKSAIFDTAKLEWMNGQYINALSAEKLAPLVTQALEQEGLSVAEPQRRRSWYLSLIDLLKPRARRVHDIAVQMGPYLIDGIDYDPQAVRKYWTDPIELAPRLELLRTRFERAPAWTTAALEKELRDVSEQLALPAAKLIHPLRVATLGTAVGPGIFDVLVALGRDLTIRRIDAAIRALTAQATASKNRA
jgi:glutamyl-tRNA synthetase